MSDTNVHRLVGNLLVGTSHFFVDTTTNQIGVNTSTPSAALDVASGDLKVGSDITLASGGTITAANFSGNGSGLSDINSDSGSWVKDDANGLVYVANSAHKVAIGTTSASELLTVGNDGVNADVVNNIRLNGRKANADGEICGLYFANSKDTGNGTTGSSASIRASRIGGSNFATQLDFYTNDGVAVGSGTSRLTILGSGNVGIGTSLPGTMLHIETPTGTASNYVRIGSGMNDGSSQSISGVEFRTNPQFYNGDNSQRVPGQIRSGFYNGPAGTANWADAYLSLLSTASTSSAALTEHVTCRGGSVGIFSTSPNSTFHVKCPSVTAGRVNIERFDDTNSIFTGLYGANTDGGRAQLVLSSAYSDLVIASSRVNNAHGSTLSFVTYNPSNSGDYRKFVINQGNWGNRKEFLDFGCSSGGADDNPHLSINSGDTVLTLDGTNKRVGIGNESPSGVLHVVDSSANGSWNKLLVRPTTLWGDGVTTAAEDGGGAYRYMTMANIMLQNPHVCTHAVGGAAHIRIGRGGGVSTGEWWDLATRTDNKFHICKTAVDTTGIVIDTAGNVGVGTSGPGRKLDVRGGDIRIGDTSANLDVAVYVNHYGGISVHNVGNLGYNISTGSSPEGWCWRFVDGTAKGPGNDYFKVFYSSGNYWHKGSNVSDERMKANFVYLDGVYALNSILKLNPLLYNDKYSDGKIDDRVKGGFIAQEVKDVIPHLVGYDEDRDQPNENGYAEAYSLDYNGVFAYNVKATQEIYKLLLIEQGKVATLETQLDEARADLETTNAKLCDTQTELEVTKLKLVNVEARLKILEVNYSN